MAKKIMNERQFNSLIYKMVCESIDALSGYNFESNDSNNGDDDVQNDDSKRRNNRRRQQVEAFFKQPGVNPAAYAYRLYGVKPVEGDDTNEMKNARSKFMKCLNHEKNEDGYEYAFTSAEINELFSMISGNEMKESIIRLSQSDLIHMVNESVKRILSEEIEMTPVRPHFGFPEEREVVEKLESMGWIPSLWNDINPREFGQEGPYIIMVGFFDYTYCVGHKDIKVGSLEQCRDIIQDIIENNRTDCQEFIEQVEDGITEFEGWDEENEDTECQISSLGFDILTPDGQCIVADARGQHGLEFIYGG